MKNKLVLLLIGLLSLSATAKKDSQAWKSETSLEKQFSIFKENSSQWDGYLMNKEIQLNEFHNAILDSVKTLEKSIKTAKVEITGLKKKVSQLESSLAETQNQLNTSLDKENSLVTLGITYNKNAFPSIMYTIISILTLALLAAVFLFYRSNVVTRETEKRFSEISTELEVQRTKAHERESKLRRELQTELNKQLT